MSVFRRGTRDADAVLGDEDLTPLDPDAPDAVPPAEPVDATPSKRRALSFRTRVALLAAAAVAVAVVLASAVAYFEVRHQLYVQVDNTLRQPQRVETDGFDGGFFGPRLPPGEQRFVQVIRTDGTTARPADQPALPVSARDRAVAAGQHEYVIESVHIDGVHMRMITTEPAGGDPTVAAVQIARSLTEADNTLGHLRIVLLLVAAGGVVIAAGLGLVVARSALRPVKRLTDAAEHVAETQDLGASIPVDRSDELGRLAESFNEMLAALASSRDQQQQLVADASHELRTPLTSLRTNIEVLARAPNIDPYERERLLADVTAQLEEFGVLVEDLVELAREDRPTVEQEMVDVRLDEVVTHAVNRARRHAPALVFEASTAPCLVRGQRQMLERALTNLLDNASKWSPDGAHVEVVQTAEGEVTVRDHGPGIAPELREKVFDRFYRAPAARSMPGSGLGLAIVRRVVEAHRGTVGAEAAPGGGTLMRVRLPVVDLEEPVPVDLEPEPVRRA
ncbi:MAG TPA: HAMP domain-containing sensor histidine kinase [Acidimicrobiia bacterium]|nr:HAMP domain-containing sensor histidine kinase [Acidimicrobiia bacterium]